MLLFDNEQEALIEDLDLEFWGVERGGAETKKPPLRTAPEAYGECDICSGSGSRSHDLRIMNPTL